MTHRFQNAWTLGRFRLSVTRSVRAGRPEPARRLPRDPGGRAEVRTDAQKTVLNVYFRAIDMDLRAKADAVNASKAPLPADPKLKELRDQLEFAKKPVAPDPALLVLRRDLEMSVEQAAVRRA